MAGYNGVLGIDENALNKFVTAVYDNARKAVFHGTVPVSHLGLGALESVEYDIAVAPKVLLTPIGSTTTESSSTAAVDLVVDNFALVLHFSEGVPPTTLEGALRATVEVIADSSGFLTPQLGTVTVDIPDEEKLTEITNKLLVPYVERYVRNQLLTPIRVPPLGYGQLALTSPALSSGAGRLLATTAIAPAVAAPAPVSWAWPDGRIFIAADFEFVNKLAATVTPKIKPVTGRWSKTLKLGFIRSTLKVDYEATLTSITLGPVAGRPDRLQGTAVVSTSIHAYAKNVGSVSGKGTTTVGLNCKAVFSAGHVLAIQLVGLNQFTPKIDFHNIPPWLEGNLGELISALSVQFRDQISAMLSAQPPVEVGRLPSFPMMMNGTTLVIGVTQPAITTITGPNGRTLLAATGIPDVHTMP